MFKHQNKKTKIMNNVLCLNNVLFLNYSWHTMLDYFQVYTIIIRHLYMTYQVIVPINLAHIWHHSQLWQCHHLYSPCCTPQPRDCSVTTNLYLTPSTFSPSLPILLLSDKHQNVLYVWFCLVYSFILAYEFHI